MAQTAPAKKMLIMNILDILKRYTDEEHKLSQKQIMDILLSEYDMAADRKTVARNLSNLMEAGYPIECNDDAERTYINKQGRKETSNIRSDFYLERDFTDAELRLLIDGLLFSKHIPYSQCKELVEKLEGLSNKYFNSRVRYIYALQETKPKNTQLFYTIEIIDEAIAAGKQVVFTYNKYGTDKKLHSERECIVNPYQMAATNGRYYLICSCGDDPDLFNYRLDRITDIRLLDTSARPNEYSKNGKQFSLNKHMDEHLYMFSGKSVVATFRMKKNILNDAIDWFGTAIAFSNETEDEVTARVTVNWSAMRYWALQYCRFVRILTPVDLAETVKNDLQKALINYEK